MSTRVRRFHCRVRTGLRRFASPAVYYDYTTDRGVVAMDRATFTRHYGELRPTSLSVYLAPGANPEAGSR